MDTIGLYLELGFKIVSEHEQDHMIINVLTNNI